jgi:4-aminobutyrate aminotransferase/(S)-3-amino-2-methylpropionate transaminase
MVGFDIVRERGTSEPDAATTKQVTMKALEHGLVLLSCGTEFNVIRILVPLTASDAILDEGLGMLEESLKLAA